MRFGTAKLRDGGPILSNGMEAKASLGVAAASDRNRHAAYEAVAGSIILSLLTSGTAHAAGRNTTPCGISPIVVIRQSAMRSLRASATTIVLRRPGAPSTRALNQSVSALSF